MTKQKLSFSINIFLGLEDGRQYWVEAVNGRVVLGGTTVPPRVMLPVSETISWVSSPLHSLSTSLYSNMYTPGTRPSGQGVTAGFLLCVSSEKYRFH